MAHGRTKACAHCWSISTVQQSRAGFATAHLTNAASQRRTLDGGEQERALAAQYRTWAHAMQAAWPRTAAALAELAEDYERYAHQEDARAEQLRLEHG